MSKTTVFLGGTAGNSKWRDALTPLLSENVDAFNPIVPDWNEEAYQNELKARKDSDFVLYVLTPETPGAYSIAEVVDDSNKRPEKTLFAAVDFGDASYEGHQTKAFDKISRLVSGNGAKVFSSLQEIADFLNA